MESEFLLAQPLSNLKFKVHYYYYRSIKFFQPGLLLKDVPLLIVSTSASLA
jgi:hypothetical protein